MGARNGGGLVTLRVDPKPEHHNQNGTVNAPVMFGLAEAAGAAAIVMGFLDLPDGLGMPPIVPAFGVMLLGLLMVSLQTV